MIGIIVLWMGMILGSIATGENVPVLIWGSSASHYTPASALKSYTSDEFTDILTTYLNEDTFGVVITEPKLTSEDITLCRARDGVTCFAGLQQIPNKVYMANVEEPVEILRELSTTAQPDINILPDGQLSETIEPEAGKFVFIHFHDEPNDDTKSRNAVLQQHDQLLAKLTRDLSARTKHLIFIYTAAAAAESDMAKREIREIARSRNATNETESDEEMTTVVNAREHHQPGEIMSQIYHFEDHTNATVFKKDNIIIYYKEMREIKPQTDLKVKSDKPISERIVYMTTMNVQQNGDTLQTELTGNEDTFTFNLTIAGGYWSIDNTMFNGVPVRAQTTMGAVQGFSFHCTPAIAFKALLNENQIFDTVLTITGLQIEGKIRPDGAATNSEPWQPLDRFSDAWDCVGFLSPGLMGGLFVSFMMTIIMLVAVSWIMDIRTMDRFDDPKGKTITIAVSD